MSTSFRFSFVFVVLLCSIDTFPVAAQEVRKIVVDFETIGDDKNWNTQVRDKIVLNGQEIANLYCCSADHDQDHWQNPSDQQRQMTLLKSVSRQDLTNSLFIVGMSTPGIDDWKFVPMLTVTYKDGSQYQHSYAEVSIGSNQGSMQKNEGTLNDDNDWLPLFPGPLLTAATVDFNTTTNDKHSDTQVRARIVSNTDLASLVCCSSDPNYDHWGAQTATTRPLALLNKHVSKGDIHNGEVGIFFLLEALQPHNNTWTVAPTLNLYYADGSTEKYVGAEKEFDLGGPYPNYGVETYAFFVNPATKKGELRLRQPGDLKPGQRHDTPSH